MTAAHRTMVKVCGITTAADAGAAVRAGADAVGVVLADSPRRITLDQAREALAGVPPLVGRVGVFVDAPADEIAEAAAALGLSAVQLHGAETPEDCVAVRACTGAAVVKAFRVRDGFSPADVEPYVGSVDAVLLDTYAADAAGGTGRTFAWDPALMPAGVPVIVAGGLSPANAGACVRALHPFAVDVSSGVEAGPRTKDPALIEAFMAAVRAADEEE